MTTIKKKITSEDLLKYTEVLMEAHFTDFCLVNAFGLRCCYSSLTCFIHTELSPISSSIQFWTNWMNWMGAGDRGRINFEQALELLAPEDQNVLLFHLDLFT